MLVVLDTNVLLSAFIRVDSNPYKVVQAWFDDSYDLVSSPAQIEELSRASRYVLSLSFSGRPPSASHHFAGRSRSAIVWIARVLIQIKGAAALRG